MWTWAWHSLRHQRSQLLGHVAGIAGAFLLALFFDAVFRGESEQIVSYPRHMQPDVWVMQKGVANMHMSTSFLWDWKADRIARLPGVQRVTPILYLNGVVDAKGRKSFSYIVGLLPGDQRAGPWQLAAGRPVAQSGEAVISEVLARLTGVKLGDTVRLSGRAFVVVGLSTGTYSSANTITFVAFRDLQDILGALGTYSFLLVDVEPGVAADRLARRIMTEVDKVHAMTQAEFIRSDFTMAMQMGVEIILLMTVISTMLAVLLVGFAAYSITMAKRRELVIMKALGATNAHVLLAVALQSVAIVLLAFLLAAAIALGVLPHITILVPQVTLVISAAALAKLGLEATAIALLGSLAPAYFIVRLDPARAFQV